MSEVLCCYMGKPKVLLKYMFKKTKIIEKVGRVTYSDKKGYIQSGANKVTLEYNLSKL